MMADQKLVSFIRKAVKDGISLKIVKSQLRERGWSESEISEAVQSAIPPEAPAPKVYCWKCGTENDPTAKGCKNCGVNLNEIPEDKKNIKEVAKFHYQDAYNITGVGVVLVGRVEGGVLEVGMVNNMGNNRLYPLCIVSIEMNNKRIKRASTGDNVGMQVSSESMKPSELFKFLKPLEGQMIEFVTPDSLQYQNTNPIQPIKEEERKKLQSKSEFEAKNFIMGIIVLAVIIGVIFYSCGKFTLSTKKVSEQRELDPLKECALVCMCENAGLPAVLDNMWLSCKTRQSYTGLEGLRQMTDDCRKRCTLSMEELIKLAEKGRGEPYDPYVN